ncbi:MAG: beta-propeller domain-containing protein, partial [Candidatus Gracilibacteria bacterium]
NEIEDKAGDYWYGNKDIKRIIYIGDNFYTVSDKSVMATDMDSMTEEKRIDFAGGPEGEDDPIYIQ